MALKLHSFIVARGVIRATIWRSMFAFFALSCTSDHVFAQTNSTWNWFFGGDWHDYRNWNSGVPNGQDAVANFNALPLDAENYPVYFNLPVTLGTLDTRGFAANQYLNLVSGGGAFLTFRSTTGIADLYADTGLLQLNAAIQLQSDLILHAQPSASFPSRNAFAQQNISGPISEVAGSHSVTIDKGVWSLGYDTNTYTGGTFIGSGGDARDSATLIGTTDSIPAAGGIHLLDANSIVTFTQQAVGTYAGVISGSGQVQVAFHDVSLTQANTYTGGTVVSFGASLIGDTNTIPSAGGINLFSADANVQFNQPGSFEGTYGVNNSTPSIYGPGGLIKSGQGSLILTGQNNYFGTTQILDGELRAGNNFTLSQYSTHNLASPGAILNLDGRSALVGGLSGVDGAIVSLGGADLLVGFNNQDTNYAGTIQGSGGLYKAGTGTLSLGNANAYTGTTTIQFGTLQLVHDQAIPTGGAVIVNSAGTLDVAGRNIAVGSLDGDGAVKLGNNGVLNVAAPAFTSSTFNGTISGAGSLFKNDEGTLFLGGQNSYTGNSFIGMATLVNNGALSTTQDNVLPQGASLGVFGPGVLQLNNTTQEIGRLYGNGQIDTGDGVPFSRVLKVGGDLSNDDILPTGFSGFITGAGSLEKVGAGRFVLSSHANTYTGGTTISAGTIQAQGDDVLPTDTKLTIGQDATFDTTSFNQHVGSLFGSGTVLRSGTPDDLHCVAVGGNDADSVFEGKISGALTLIKDGSGTFILASSTSDYSGGTFLNAGTLKAGAYYALPPSTKLNIAESATFDTGGLDQQVGSLFGTGTVLGDSTPNTFPTQFTIGAGDSDSEFGGKLTAHLSLVKQGNGTLTLTAGSSNDYSDSTFIHGGTIQAAASNVLPTSTALDVDFGATFDGSDYDQQIAVLGGAGTIRGNGRFTVGAGTFDSYFEGQLTGGLSLIKEGDGTLTLASSTSDYSGNTILNAGTLRAASYYVLPVQTTLVVNPGATFDLASTDQEIGSLFGSGSVTNSDLPAGLAPRLTVGANGSDSHFDGVLSGYLGLVKQGGGTLTLTGANTYTGTTHVLGGALQVDSTSLPSASFTELNNAELVFQQDTDGEYGGNIYGNGHVVKSGFGSLTFSGSNDYAGRTSLFYGTLQAGSTAAFSPNSAYELDDFGTLDLNDHYQTIGSLSGADGAQVRLGTANLTTGQNGTDTTFAGQIHGTGGLVKEGMGALTLSNANDYSGPTSINAGSLVAANTLGSATGSGPLAIHNGGTLGGTGAISGAVAISAGGIVAPGMSVGTLSVGSLSITTGSILNFEFNGSSGNDQIIVNDLGGLTINGGGFDLYREHSTSPWDTAGQYKLIQYHGAIAGAGLDSSWTTLSALNPHVLNPVPGLNYRFDDTTNPGFVTLTVGAQQAGVWNVNSDGSWSTGTNWTANQAPNSPGDSAQFLAAIDAHRTVSVDTPVTVGSIKFNNTKQYTIAGSAPLTLDNASNVNATITNELGTHEISAPLRLASHLDVNSTPGAITALSGNISETSGPASLVATGGGTLVLAGNNSFSGGLLIDSGTVVTHTTASIPNQSDIEIGGNGTLTLHKDPANGNSYFNGQVRSVTGQGRLEISSGAVLGVSPDADVTFQGELAGDGTLIINGTHHGSFALAGTNSFNGSILNSAGVINIASSAALPNASDIQNYGTFNLNGFDLTATHFYTGGGSVNLGSGTLAGDTMFLRAPVTGTGGVTFNGSGVIQSQHTYSGTTKIISGETDIVDGNAPNSQFVLSPNTLLKVDSGLLLDSTITIGSLSGDIGSSLQLNKSTATVVTGGDNRSSTFAGNIHGPGGLTKEGSGTFTLTGANDYTGATTVNGGTLVGNTASLPRDIVDNATVVFDQNSDGVYAGVISGSGGFTKRGTGQLELSGTHTYNGATNIEEGTLLLTAHNYFIPQHLPASTAVNVAAGATLAIHESEAPYGQTIAGLTGHGRVNIEAGTVLNISPPATGSTFAGEFSGDGYLYFDNVGSPGVMNLNGTGSFSGSVSVGALTTLNLSSATALHAALRVVNSGGIDLQNVDNAINNLDNSGVVNLGSARLTLSGALFDGGDVTGAGGLTFDHPELGYLGFSIYHDLSYSGPTLIRQGSVNLAAAVPNSQFVLSPGTTLFVGVTLQHGLQQRIGSLAGSTGATVNLDDPFHQGLELIVGSDSRSSTYSGSIVGAGGLVKTGAGTLTLDGQLSYTGHTTVLGGRLIIGSNSALPGGLNNSPGATLSIATGKSLNANVTNLGTITLAAGSTLNGSLENIAGGIVKGFGDISQKFTDLRGGRMQFGASPGAVTAASAEWAAGAIMDFEINDALGSMGLNPGWDALHVVGDLQIDATATDPMLLNVFSLTLANIAGNAAHFDPFRNYSWAFATFGSITYTDGSNPAFDPSKFRIDMNGFTNVIGDGYFTVAQGDHELDLVFHAATAVPEPHALGLALCGGLLMSVTWRLRRPPRR